MSLPWPEIFLFLTAIVVLFYGLFFPENRKSLVWITLGGTLITLCLAIFQFGIDRELFGGMYVVSPFSSYMKFLFLIAAVFVTLSASDFIDRAEHPSEFFALILLSVLGLTLMTSSVDLIAIFLGLELASMPSYVLAAFDKKRERSIEAGMKYFIMGIATSAVSLYGLVLLYGLTGATNLHLIDSKAFGLSFQPGALLALAMIIGGFGFKIALVPFHFWAPDVYEGSPTPVTAFFAVAPKAAAISVLARILVTSLPASQDKWSNALWLLSIITMTFGNLLALKQTNIKRMLAYSSIAQAGYILIGITVATISSISASLMYMMIYLFMTVGAFTVVYAVTPEGNEEIITFSGLSKKAPFMAFAMSAFMFSLIGIPPLAGFFGKFYLFFTAINKGFIVLASILAINSVISAYYYLNIVRRIYFEEPLEPDRDINPSSLAVTGTALALLSLIVIGVFPKYLIWLASTAIL